MATKVAINGFGRIGRLVFRILAKRRELEVVAVNDLAPAETNVHLLKYDTTHGRYAGEVRLDGKTLHADGRAIAMLAEKDPAKLPWKAMGVDIVVEGTGVFTSREGCGLHLAAGARKVLLTAPPKDDLDAMIVLGVNDDALKPEHRLVSQRLVHDELPRARREGPPRGVRHRARVHEHGPRLHERPEPARPARTRTCAGRAPPRRTSSRRRRARRRRSARSSRRSRVGSTACRSACRCGTGRSST